MIIKRYILALALLVAGCSEKPHDKPQEPYGKVPDDIRQSLKEALSRNELPSGTRPPPAVLDLQRLELNGVDIFRCPVPELGALATSGFSLRSDKHNDYLVNSNGISIWLPANILYFSEDQGELTCKLPNGKNYTFCGATSAKDVVEHWGTPYFIEPHVPPHHKTTDTYYYENPDYELLFFFDDTDAMTLSGMALCYGFHYLADTHTRSAMLGCTNSWPPWGSTNKRIQATSAGAEKPDS